MHIVYLEHLWSHEVIIADQRDNLIGEYQHDFKEQYGDVRAPSNAVKVHGILGLAFDPISSLFVFVLFIAVEKCMVEQHRQYYVGHQKHHVRIPGVPSSPEHNHHIIVQTKEL